eukprot:3620777-Pleurochrysis_carterae.AAC.3
MSFLNPRVQGHERKFTTVQLLPQLSRRAPNSPSTTTAPAAIPRTSCDQGSSGCETSSPSCKDGVSVLAVPRAALCEELRGCTAAHAVLRCAVPFQRASGLRYREIDTSS